jgi:hypothetical protein
MNQIISVKVDPELSVYVTVRGGNREANERLSEGIISRFIASNLSIGICVDVELSE